MSLNNEFVDFMASDTKTPEGLGEAIMRGNRNLRKPLRPALITALIQAFACALTLVLCPQFGLGATLWGEEIVHHIFHQSPLLCGAYCGFVYLGASSFLTGLVLPRDYLRILEELKIVRFSIGVIMVMAILGLARLKVGSIETSASYIGAWLVVGFLSYVLMSHAAQRLRIIKIGTVPD